MTAQQKHAAAEFYRYTGGLGVTSNQITSAAGSGLLAAAGIVAAIPGLQIPGAILAAVGAMTTLIGGMFRPDLTKIEATRIVDGIEAQTLKPLLNSWRALPAEKKTFAMQDLFLQVFNKAWQGVLEGCANPALRQAGVNCIGDRAESSCHWTLDGRTPGNPPDCGNWFTWYRDPIANDPAVHAEEPAVVLPGESLPGGGLFDGVFGGPSSTGGFNLFGGSGAGLAIPKELLIGGALLAFAFALGGD